MLLGRSDTRSAWLAWGAREGGSLAPALDVAAACVAGGVPEQCADREGEAHGRERGVLGGAHAPNSDVRSTE